MNELEDIYKRIEYLRNNGVKMKEIADWIHMAPSVLSALYSSVLPTYLNLQKTKPREEALDEALALVNNVSKKRLLGNLGEMKERLFDLEPNQEANITGNAFLKLLEKEMQESGGGSLQLQWHVPELQPFFIDRQPQGRTLFDLCIRKQ